MGHQLSYATPQRPSVDELRTLRLLGIFHCAWNGLILCSFLVIRFVFENDPRITAMQDIMAVYCAAQLLSGVFMLLRRFWIYSIIMTALECPLFPMWTILGVYTLVVLSGRRIRLAYKIRD